MAKILVALDESEASRRMLPELAARAGSSHLVLFHVLPPFPPGLLESRGADDPREEQRIEGRQQRKQDEWLRQQAAGSTHLLAECRRTLETLGVVHDRIQIRIAEPIQVHGGLADTIIQEAKQLGCETIAVGRQAFSILRESFHTHLGDALRAQAQGLDVWIIE